MRDSKRNELIDAYYFGLDAEEYETLDDLFTGDATHERPGQGTLTGAVAIRAYFESDRRSFDTVHEVQTRIHEDDVTYCKVRVSGELPDQSFKGDVIAEFTFDDDRIASYKVYRGYQR